MSPADDIQVSVEEPETIAVSVTPPPAVVVATVAAPDVVMTTALNIGPPGPPGPAGPPGPEGPPGLGADSGGAATQIGVWEDADTIKGSSALTQDANGITVQRDFIGNHSADFHGLKSATGRVLFGPTDMFIATLAAGASITLVPGNNDYGSAMMIREGSTAFQRPVELPGDPTQPTQAATKSYVDNRAQTPGPQGPAGAQGAPGAAGPAGSDSLLDTARKTKVGSWVQAFIWMNHTNLGTQGRLLMVRCAIPFDFNEVAVETTTGTAAATALFGVYNIDADGWPTTLAANQVTPIDCSTVAMKSVPLSATLAAGVYWMGVLLKDTGPAFRSTTMPVYTVPTPVQALPTGSTQCCWQYFGTTLPANGSGGSVGASAPLIWVRRAA